MLFAANGKRERENGENTSGKESPSGKAAGIRRGHAHFDAKRIYEIVEREGPISAPLLKSQVHVPAAAFDRELIHLQMQTFIVPSDFLFSRDKQGNKKYSYGTTVYDLPERWLGASACALPERISPEASYRRMVDHLASRLPAVPRGLIEKMLK